MSELQGLGDHRSSSSSCCCSSAPRDCRTRRAGSVGRCASSRPRPRACGTTTSERRRPARGHPARTAARPTSGRPPRRSCPRHRNPASRRRPSRPSTRHASADRASSSAAPLRRDRDRLRDRAGGRRAAARPRGADAPDRAPARAAPAGLHLSVLALVPGVDPRLDLLRHADPLAGRADLRRRRSRTTSAAAPADRWSSTACSGPFNLQVKVALVAGVVHRQPGLALPPVGLRHPRAAPQRAALDGRLPGHRRPAVLRRRRGLLLDPAAGHQAAARLHPGPGRQHRRLQRVPVDRDAADARLRPRLRGPGLHRAAQPGRASLPAAEAGQLVAADHRSASSSSPPSRRPTGDPFTMTALAAAAVPAHPRRLGVCRSIDTPPRRRADIDYADLDDDEASPRSTRRPSRLRRRLTPEPTTRRPIRVRA